MPYPLLGLTQVLHAMKPAFPQLTKEQNRLFLVCLCRLTAYWREAPPQQIALNGSPEASLRALWLAASGRGCTLPAAMHCPLPMLHPGEITRLKASIDRFVSGVPLAHLTGWWHFMGLDFLASPEALIPRPETERLGARSRALLKQILQRRGNATIFEPCTGSGNLAIALAHSELNCRVHAIDLSSDALNLARQNAALHNVGERVKFHAGDLFAPLENLSPLDARADLVVCNPPYISSPKVEARSGEILKYGPRMAFDGGPFGLSIVTRLIHEGPRYLKPDSFLCFEIGAGQGPFLAKLMHRMPEYADVQVIPDADTQTGVIIAQTRADSAPAGSV